MVIRDIRYSAQRKLIRCLCFFTAFLVAPALTWADSTAFDLKGPRIEMKVTRNGKPLPISDVPNLQAGDRIWIHPDFPEDQSAAGELVHPGGKLEQAGTPRGNCRHRS